MRSFARSRGGNESHRSYRMHDSKTRRRPRSPLSGVSTHLRRRYVELPLSPCSLSIATPPPRAFLRSYRCARDVSRLPPRVTPVSKSPLFIANGFRIMMPGWLRDPIQIPRVSSSTRFPSPPSLPPPLCFSVPRPLSLSLFSHPPRARGCYCRRRDCSRSRSFE